MFVDCIVINLCKSMMQSGQYIKATFLLCVIHVSVNKMSKHVEYLIFYIFCFLNAEVYLFNFYQAAWKFLHIL
jgi:hypothetical protein